MKNQTILKITIIITILGIIVLLFLMNIITPTQIKIKDIDDNSLNQKVEVVGLIQAIKTYKTSNFQVITINDSTGKIDITLDRIVNVTINKKITVIGKVTEYKGNLQVQADKIILE